MFKNICIQLVIFFLAFNIISWFREMNMLPDAPLKAEQMFVLPSLMDGDMTLKANNKTTVLYFFAPWCKVCNYSINNLENLYLKEQNIDVIAIALDYETIDEVKNFSQQHKLTLPVVLGNFKVKDTYKINAYPSYYVLDKNNNITAKSLGYSSELGLLLRTQTN